MTIKRLEIRNFKSLVNCELDLKRLNVLVGPNSSGKSSIIQVLRLLAHAAQANVSGSDFPLNTGTFKFGTFDQIRSRFLFGDEEPGDDGVVLGVEIEPGRDAMEIRRTGGIGPTKLQVHLDSARMGESVSAGSAFIRKVVVERSDNAVRGYTSTTELAESFVFEHVPFDERERLDAAWLEWSRFEERLFDGFDPSSAAAMSDELLTSALYRLIAPGSERAESSGVDGSYVRLRGCAPVDEFKVGAPSLEELDNFLRRLVRRFIESELLIPDEQLEAAPALGPLKKDVLRSLQLAALFGGPVEEPAASGMSGGPVSIDPDEWSYLVTHMTELFIGYVAAPAWGMPRGRELNLLSTMFEWESEEPDLSLWTENLKHLRVSCWKELQVLPLPLWRRGMSGRRSGMFMGARDGDLESLGALWARTLGRIAYMSGLRNEPQVVDGYRDSSVPMIPLGTKGEYTSSVLLDESELKFHCPCPRPDGVGFSLEEMSLRDGVAFWLDRFGIARRTQSDALENIGVRTKLVDHQTGFELDLSYLGVGASQLLPIIVLCLRAGAGDIVLLEQPEIHLHPGAQQILGDFLLGIAARGTQVVVETHSEYLVNRLRLRMVETGLDEHSRIGDRAQSTVASDQISIWFCERHEGMTSAAELKPTPDGSFTDWPEGFFDQGPREAEQILMAAMRRLQGAATEQPEPDL